MKNHSIIVNHEKGANTGEVNVEVVPNVGPVYTLWRHGSQ